MIGYIYKTTNTINGKIYIGQHVAPVFEPNKYIGSGKRFKKAVEKYGIENFVCELLAECFTTAELHEKEAYYIALYNAQDNNIGYNILGGGFDVWNRGKQMSEAYCAKASKAQRDRAQNVSCYDLTTGKLIQVFNSAYDAAEFLDLDTPVKTVASRINVVCRTDAGHAYNYIWRLENKRPNVMQLSQEELLTEHTNPRARRVVQFDKNLNKIAVHESAAAYSKTITEIYKQQRVIAKGITDCCNGKQYSAYGFIWKYESDLENDGSDNV